MVVPLRSCVPLLISWQSSIEINRVLSMKFDPDQIAPAKVELYGRKGRKKAY